MASPFRHDRVLGLHSQDLVQRGQHDNLATAEVTGAGAGVIQSRIDLIGTRVI